MAYVCCCLSPYFSLFRFCMCLFPFPNMDIDGIAYKKGVYFFDCGSCPECLRKRSSAWALRSVYEARCHVFNCMITLTYDTFVRDKNGNYVLDSRGNRIENPVDPNLKVNQRDIQLFIKRLRKWQSTFSDEKIKYLACAEYGSHTHRAHYHCILFGVRFPDYHFYKKSKRGNPIYMSNILTKLWNHGICTIDSINVHSSIARYCTKYCAKDRSDSTFMLFSQSLGVSELMKDFNGYNYMIDGREYPIPRVVWQRYITDKYKFCGFQFSPKYVNKGHSFSLSDLQPYEERSPYFKSCILREAYRLLRDSDPVYIRYLDYWKKRGELFDSMKPSVRQRIYSLPEDKYHFYKLAALDCLDRLDDKFVLAPNSNVGRRYYIKSFDDSMRSVGIRVHIEKMFQLPFPSRLNTATDTKLAEIELDNAVERAVGFPFASVIEENLQNSREKFKKRLIFNSRHVNIWT